MYTSFLLLGIKISKRCQIESDKWIPRCIPTAIRNGVVPRRYRVAIEIKAIWWLYLSGSSSFLYNSLFLSLFNFLMGLEAHREIKFKIWIISWSSSQMQTVATSSHAATKYELKEKKSIDFLSTDHLPLHTVNCFFYFSGFWGFWNLIEVPNSTQRTYLEAYTKSETMQHCWLPIHHINWKRSNPLTLSLQVISLSIQFFKRI